MDILYLGLISAHIVLATLCAGHALLYKRDSVAALGWIAVCLGYPLAGPILYFFFGINRTTRQARRQFPVAFYEPLLPQTSPLTEPPVLMPTVNSSFTSLTRLSQSLSDRALVTHNHVIPLQNGEEAYPAMLHAISQAKHFILLTTYIFETNATGLEFIEALLNAHRRHVQINIIIDGVGDFHAYPRASQLLHAQGINVARFHAPKLWPLSLSINLRNHRKLLVVDGHTAFTGGMNIGGRHLAFAAQNKHPVIDLHFQLTGPIVQQCEHLFRDDWFFTTQQTLDLPAAPLLETGTAFCRVIEDGPNEYLGKISTLLIHTLAIAKQSVWIMTPYFLPSVELTNALQAAALRGVEVTILLPQKNNLPYVQWASVHIWPRLIHYGVHIYTQPPPFVHTKLWITDEYYTLIGSANLDPRSLRLNFELDIEIYDTAFAQKMALHCQNARQNAHLITKTDISTQPLWKKIRNALCWLFSPYL